MRWDDDTVTIKGERLALTNRGKVFFRTVTYIKDGVIMVAGIGLLWLFIAVMAVMD